MCSSDLEGKSAVKNIQKLKTPEEPVIFLNSRQPKVVLSIEGQ